jgi:hypothetical protein
MINIFLKSVMRVSKLFCLCPKEKKLLVSHWRLKQESADFVGVETKFINNLNHPTETQTGVGYLLFTLALTFISLNAELVLAQFPKSDNLPAVTFVYITTDLAVGLEEELNKEK